MFLENDNTESTSMYVLFVNGKIFLIILLKIALLWEGIFVENGYMQSTYTHGLSTIDKDF